MITKDQYFIGRKHSIEQGLNADFVLASVNALISRYTSETGTEVPVNPKTNSQISGETNGGFRLPDCPIGAADSSHKQGQAVDVYDPFNDLDDWVTDEILTEFGLYREHPDSTQHWCHLTTRAPHSGNRTFIP